VAGTDEKDIEEVPRLPRGRGLKLDGPMMFRIGATVILLVMILLMRRPCADATSKFVTGFDEGSATVAKPGTIDLSVDAGAGSASMEYVGGSATEQEVRDAWERAKARSRAEAGSGSGSGSGLGSATGSGSGSGSATGSGSGSATRSGSGSSSK
jgi:hypothetical protein